MNQSLFLTINSWAGQNYWLDKLMIFSADWLGYVLLGGVVYLFYSNTLRYRGMFLISVISAITSRFVIVAAIRYFYYNPRPFLVLENINQLMNHDIESSFPSGHASFYFALAMGVYLYNKKAGYAYFALAGLMGFARIFVSVHWPLDIVAGAALGMATATCFYYMNQAKERLRPFSR